MKGHPTLEDFCNVANDLYAAPSEERFYAVVNLARELLALSSAKWDDGYKFANSGAQADREMLIRLLDKTIAIASGLLAHFPDGAPWPHSQAAQELDTIVWESSAFRAANAPPQSADDQTHER